MCIGENFVSLTGFIYKPVLNEYSSGAIQLKAKMALPDGLGNYQYLNIVCWGDMADALYKVGPKKCVRIHGHIEESMYDKTCRFCGGKSRVGYVTITVDNFKCIEE